MPSDGNPLVPTTPTPTPTPSPTPETTPTPPAADPAAPPPQPPEEKPPETVLGTPSEDIFDPEKLVLPEGFEKSETYNQFVEIAKEAGFKGTVAQRMLDLHTAAIKEASNSTLAAWRTQVETWTNEVKAEFGDKLPGLQQVFARVSANAELTDPGFREALVLTGAGSNPAIVRTMFKWAAALGEGSRVAGNPVQPNGAVPQTIGEVFYGNRSQ